MIKANLPGRFEGSNDEAPHTLQYKDKGCEKAKRLGYYGPCLDCIFDPCLEDGFRSAQKTKKKTRNDKMLKAIRHGKSVKEIAEEFGICTRTVNRVIKRGGHYH